MKLFIYYHNPDRGFCREEWTECRIAAPDCFAAGYRRFLLNHDESVDTYCGCVLADAIINTARP
jgi:hypothetical protein